MNQRIGLLLLAFLLTLISAAVFSWILELTFLKALVPAVILVVACAFLTWLQVKGRNK